MLKRNKSCIIYNRNRVSFSQISHEADMIAAHLQPYITDKSVIGIALRRTPQLISAMLASIQLKVPFIPLDTHIPSERTKKIAAIADMSHLITSKDITTEYNISNIMFIEDMTYDINTIQENVEYTNDIIYILFTSGSTGTPKGVKVTYQGFQNFMEGISEAVDFTPGKRIACLTAVSFDIFFLESLIALYQGLTVVLANEEEYHNPKLMAKFIQENDVEMLQMTPSCMQLLLNYDKELKSMRNVKEIMIGGEPFPINMLRILQEKTNAKIYNMYGPTETTIWSTVSNLTNKDSIDIGRPIKGTEVYIVDENLFILPDGQPGEICIGGKGLAKGYIGNNELTVQKFTFLPQRPGVRIYRTGDMGRRLPDGNLDYIGRVDNQVKIRGHRIELEEIETYINQFNDVKQSTVMAIDISETDKILVAFYTSEISIASKDLIGHLSKKLPEYMMPTIFKRVDRFIQTSNGKIDRTRVLECIEINEKVTTNLACDSLTDTQKKVLNLIRANIDEKMFGGISLEDDFKSIGLNSITFISIIVALESELDMEFDDEMLLMTAYSTIGSMVEYVESKINCN